MTKIDVAEAIIRQFVERVDFQGLQVCLNRLMHLTARKEVVPKINVQVRKIGIYPKSLTIVFDCLLMLALPRKDCTQIAVGHPARRIRFDSLLEILNGFFDSPCFVVIVALLEVGLVGCRRL